MDKAIIFVGREARVESYQLLIDCSYTSASYDGSSERELFFDELSDTFVSRLLEENRLLEVGTFNGLRINTQTGRKEQISKLEDELVEQLREKIRHKYTRIRPAIPAPSAS